MTNAVIGANSSVIFHFDIKLSDGSAAESTRVHNKPAKLQMGDGSISPAFEAKLAGLQAGDKKTFTLAPQDAYGMPNPDNIYYVDRSKFSADAPAKPGFQIRPSYSRFRTVPAYRPVVRGHLRPRPLHRL